MSATNPNIATLELIFSARGVHKKGRGRSGKESSVDGSTLLTGTFPVKAGAMEATRVSSTSEMAAVAPTGVAACSMTVRPDIFSTTAIPKKAAIATRPLIASGPGPSPLRIICSSWNVGAPLTGVAEGVAESRMMEIRLSFAPTETSYSS